MFKRPFVTIAVRFVPLFALCAIACAFRAAWADGIQITAPVDGAIIRETVNVRVAPASLPASGYVAVFIDGQFRTARVLPKDGGPVYIWDTKASYTAPDDPDTKLYLHDGSHTLELRVFDNTSEVGSSTVNVSIANAITPPSAEGVILKYKWHPDEYLRYQRDTQMDNGSGTVLQTSSVRFSRSVEDVDGDYFLVRDRVLPTGTIVNNGTTASIETAYNLKSDYRTVDSLGQVVETMQPLTQGDHIGFSIPVLPVRRVTIGDSWQAPEQISLQWASASPATVIAESRLEAFEWQNGYPTARIRETFTGSATFASSDPAQPPVTVDGITFERLVWFAYNSGRMIRSRSTLSVGADLPPAAMALLGTTAPGASGAIPGGPGAPYGGQPNIGPGGLANPAALAQYYGQQANAAVAAAGGDENGATGVNPNMPQNIAPPIVPFRPHLTEETNILL